jgi:hypothetical protein
MPFGLSTSSQGGLIQIDQDYRCPPLISEGYVGTMSGGVALVNLTLPGVTPQTAAMSIFAIQPTQFGKYVGKPYVNYAWPNTSTAVVFGLAAECPFYWRMFAFDMPPINDGSGYGLEVYRANGGLSYSSRERYMNVFLKSVFNYYVTGQNPTPTVQIPFSNPAAGMPWIVLNTLPSWFIEGDESAAAFEGCVRISAPNLAEFRLLSESSSLFYPNEYPAWSRAFENTQVLLLRADA